MYHRGLIALRGADATFAGRDVTRAGRRRQRQLRHRAASPSGRTSPPGARTAYQRTSSRSTWTRPRSTRGSTACRAVPEHHAVDRPAQQDGRLPAPGHGDDGGQHCRHRHAERGRVPQAVYLLSKAMGQNGGNIITAEFRAPAAGTLNAPLSITVTDGTWRTHDPADAARATASRDQIPTKDIVVNLATDAAGVLSTTAAQLVAALFADPAAGALVTASTTPATRARARPGDRRAHLPGRRRHDQRPDFSSSRSSSRTTCAAARPTGPAASPRRPPRPARSSARTRATSPRPVQPEGLPDHQRGQPRRGQDRHLHLLRAARPRVGRRITCLETAQRLVTTTRRTRRRRTTSTTSTSSSCRSSTLTARTTRSTTTPSSART